MRCLVLFLLGIVWAASVWAESPPKVFEVSSAAEYFYPFGYVIRGYVVGRGVEFAEDLLEKLNYRHTNQVYQWYNLQHKVRYEANVLAYPVMRTPFHEKRFKWVGTLFPIRFYLYRLKSRSDIEIRTIEDVKKYRISVERNSMFEFYFRSHGMTPENTPKLTRTLSTRMPFDRVLSGENDIFGADQIYFKNFCERLRVKCEEVLTPAFPLREMFTDMYLAYSPQTADSVVEETRRAYEELVREGRLRHFFGEYWE